jgi:histidine triad (HIT) family protein
MSGPPNDRAVIGCPFCDRIRCGDCRSLPYDCVAFAPLYPVTPGHLLVVPRRHAADASRDPEGAANAMRAAAELLRDMDFHDGPALQANIITSIGPDATQTVLHTHLHIVPRVAGDGLHLPWTGAH